MQHNDVDNQPLRGFAGLGICAVSCICACGGAAAPADAGAPQAPQALHVAPADAGRAAANAAIPGPRQGSLGLGLPTPQPAGEPEGAGFGNHRDHLVVHLKPKACGNAQLLAGTEAALRVWLGKAAGVAILEAKTQAPSAPHDAGALERALDDLLVGQVAVRLAPSTPPRTRAMQQSIARRLQRHACIASAEATIFMKGSAG